MRTISKLIALAMVLGASSVLALDSSFGTNNNGYDNHVPSAPEDAGVSWTVDADSVTYVNSGIVDTGTKNSSFLRNIILDRSVGQSYTMTGTLTWNSGNPDQNCRLGMYMFGDSAVIPDQLEQGAIGIIWNTDDGAVGTDTNADDDFSLYTGIDSDLLAGGGARTQTLVPVASDLWGTQISFSTVIDFVDVGGTNMINVAATMTAGGEDTVVSTSVVAADFTGDYFGFVNRARDSVSVPWSVSYESFAVPEPATMGLFGIGALGVWFIRRNKIKATEQDEA
jgi:hypothetical protein